MVFVSSDAFVFGSLITLVLIIGAVIYRLREKEDKYEDRKH